MVEFVGSVQDQVLRSSWPRQETGSLPAAQRIRPQSLSQAHSARSPSHHGSGAPRYGRPRRTLPLDHFHSQKARRAVLCARHGPWPSKELLGGDKSMRYARRRPVPIEIPSSLCAVTPRRFMRCIQLHGFRRDVPAPSHKNGTPAPRRMKRRPRGRRCISCGTLAPRSSWI